MKVFFLRIVCLHSWIVQVRSIDTNWNWEFLWLTIRVYLTLNFDSGSNRWVEIFSLE